MEWLRNLFKTHTRKRIESRKREEREWRATQRSAGQPTPRHRRQVHTIDESMVA